MEKYTHKHRGNQRCFGVYVPNNRNPPNPPKGDEEMTETGHEDEWPRLLAYLMRGAWGYYWTDHGKTSYWWPAGNPRPLPSGGTVGNWYSGVHPITVRRGTYQRGTRATVAAVNCLFAELDAKDHGGMAGALDRLCLATPKPAAWYVVATATTCIG